VDAQHAFQSNGWPSGLAALRVEWLDQVTQFLPGDQFIKQLQRLLAPRRLAELLEPFSAKVICLDPMVPSDFCDTPISQLVRFSEVPH
jgi:hypothetical protein